MLNSFAEGDKNYKRSEQETHGSDDFFQLTRTSLASVLWIISYLFEAESSIFRALRVLLLNLFLPFADLIYHPSSRLFFAWPLMSNEQSVVAHSIKINPK